MNMMNPDMINNLMNNDEIKKMMNDPKIMEKLGNIMGEKKEDYAPPNLNNDLFDGLSKPMNEEPPPCSPDSCPYPSNTCPCPGTTNKFELGTKIVTHNLKSETFNNCSGTIEDNLNNGRYVILFDDNRTASIKEENLLNKYENIENID